MRPLFLAVILISGSLATAYACRTSCKSPGPASAARQAKVAFVGTVTKTNIVEDCVPKHPDWCTRSYSYDVAVESVWKGKVGKTIVVDAGTNTGDCTQGKLGKNIDNQRWLFFSRTETLTIYMCSGTRRASDKDIAAITAALGAPSAP